jgi:hypothetical protein
MYFRFACVLALLVAVVNLHSAVTMCGPERPGVQSGITGCVAGRLAPIVAGTVIGAVFAAGAWFIRRHGIGATAVTLAAAAVGVAVSASLTAVLFETGAYYDVASGIALSAFAVPFVGLALWGANETWSARQGMTLET